MTEAEFLQHLGRKQLALDVLLEEYRKLLTLVAHIKSGDVLPEAVTLLPGDAWRVDIMPQDGVAASANGVYAEE